MRNWFLGSAVALTVVVAFLAVARAQTDHSGAAKTSGKVAAFRGARLFWHLGSRPFHATEG